MRQIPLMQFFTNM